MQALQYTRPGQIDWTDIPVPEPGADEVLVKVVCCGICGTDLHILKEEAPAADKVVLGHEFCGTVTAVGKQVKYLLPGDFVAVDPNNHCGTCTYCRQGQVHFCSNISPVGIRHNGGWAEYSTVPAGQCYTLPPETDPVWGALPEPISCIIHGWDRINPISENSAVLILGCGIIGLLWFLTLRNNGIKDITAAEPQMKRLGNAKNLGIKAVHPEQILKEKHTYNIIIDCSGNTTAIEQTFPLLKPMGKLLFFGICPQDAEIRINPFKIFQKELNLIGSVINPFTFPRAIDLIQQIHVAPQKLGVETFALAQYKEALEAARSGSVTKVFFKPISESIDTD